MGSLEGPSMGSETVAGGESVEALIGREVPEPVLAPAWTRDEALGAKRAPLRSTSVPAGRRQDLRDAVGGHRRKDRGTRVVVAWAETYGRPKTTEMLQGLDVVPPASIVYRGRSFQEMDTEAVAARRPDVALVDELAHTNIPGASRAKRWENVLDLLTEGIEVITTVNVQHVESLNDVVAAVTGIRQRETVPDWVVDAATRSNWWTCHLTRSAAGWCTATSTPTRGRQSSRCSASSRRRT
jgi:hypothetical protein